ncbi:MAG: YIP1 family protein [Acidobacteriota bacterium]
MSEENQNWEAPMPPIEPKVEMETPQMFLIQTLTDIFFSPSEVFEDLRKKPFPRLIYPLLLSAVLIAGFTFALNQKLGAERIVKEQLNSKWMANLPDEAKKKMAEDAKNTSTLRTVMTSSIGGIAFLIIFLIIGLVYWGGGLAFGGSGNYWHALAVVGYSTFPALLISMVASLIILYFKAPEDISFMDSQGGLLKLNPSLLIDASNVVKALFSRFDLLVIWGLIWGKIGVEKVFKISSGSAWLFSIIIWLIGTALVLVGGVFAG